MSAYARVQKLVRQNLGIIRADQADIGIHKKERRDDLLKYETYYNSSQYDDKISWDEALDSPYHVPNNQRKPTVLYPLPKIIVDRLKSKLVGERVFPEFKIQEDENTNEILKYILKMTKFKGKIDSVIRDLLIYGSAFIRIKLVDGVLMLEGYNPNHCWPKFDKNEQLESLEIRFVFEKLVDYKMQKYWYKLELTKNSDILYDNPKFDPGSVPVFSVKERVNHNLGFVQGEWVKSTYSPREIDGESVIKDIISFSDCLNYLLSMSDSAAKYNIDPQTVFTGLQAEELKGLTKSKEKAWTLGPTGQAQFLETNGNGVDGAMNFSGDMMQRVQDATRVILHDPEKFSMHAQSGKALEVINGPMIDKISEIRNFVEPFLTTLITKLLGVFIIYNRKGEIPLSPLPADFTPKSLNLVVEWQPVFPMSTQDLNDLVNLYTSMTNANLISRETALQKLAGTFDIEDIEGEVHKVNTQQQFNSFF